MAVNDIYRVTAKIENPSGASSFSVYYRETLQAVPAYGALVLGDAWAQQISPSLRAVLSSDFWHPSVLVRKVFSGKEAPWLENLTTQVGTAGTPALPSNNALLVRLVQSQFPAKSSGRIFIPGIPEVETTTGTINQDFVEGPIQAFVDALFQPIAGETPRQGEWEPGVISAKVLNAAPPAKDWAGAFAPIVQVVGWPIIATQRRRATKVVGTAA